MVSFDIIKFISLGVDTILFAGWSWYIIVLFSNVSTYSYSFLPTNSPASAIFYNAEFKLKLIKSGIL